MPSRRLSSEAHAYRVIAFEDCSAAPSTRCVSCDLTFGGDTALAMNAAWRISDSQNRDTLDAAYGPKTLIVLTGSRTEARGLAN